MASINLSYDEISDTLYITFGKNQEAMGIALNEDFLLRIDPTTHKPIGLTVLNYRHVAQSDSSPVSGLTDLPSELSATIMKILKVPPLSPLISISGSDPPRIKIRIHDSRIENMVGVYV